MNAPVLLATFRSTIRLNAEMVTSDDTATQATWQISTASNFATTLVDSTATSDWAGISYTIETAQETSTLYVRAKVGRYDPILDGNGDPVLDGNGDPTYDLIESAWSSTLTVAANTAPTAPTLTAYGATPQRIAVGIVNLTGEEFGEAVYQFSTASDFSTISFEIAGGLLVEYRVAEADRTTTHYVRAKTRNLVDYDTNDNPLYLESGWSDTLTVSGAGKIASIDVAALSADKITSGAVNSNIVIASGKIVAGNDPDTGSGGYVQMKGSGIEWVPLGQTNPSVTLPATGDAVFSGVSINASKGLDATNVTFRGTGGLGDNTELTLSKGGVQDPTSTAAVASVWPTQLTTSSDTWQGAAYDSAGTSFWFANSDGVKSYTTGGTAGANLSFAAQGWTARTSNATGELWDIDYSATDDLWVAVSSNGEILTSSDGITWTSRTSGTTSGIYGVGRSDSADLWVIVGGSGYTRTSTDGITWTSRTNGSVTLFDVAYSSAEAQWVAVGLTGYTKTSPDGITWTLRNSTGNTLRGVARSENDDLWVAVGDSGTILTSSNGTSWTTRTSGTTRQLNRVARSDSADLWVAVGLGGTILTSPDGTTWTSRTSGTAATIYGVGYGSGIWVATVNDGTVLTSSDGITWTTRSTGLTARLRAVARAEGDGIWVAVGAATIGSSPDAGIGFLSGTMSGVAVGTGDSSTSRGFALAGSTLARWNKSTGAELQQVSVSTYTSKAARAALFYDDSKVKVITQDASGTGGKVQLVAYDPANLSTAPTTQTLDSGFTGSFSFYGAARFTAGTTDYYAIALSDSTRSGVYCFNATSGSRAATYDFYDSQGNVPDGGIAYDGTRFYTLATPTSTALQKHSTFHPGAATQNTYVRYAYADATYSTAVSAASTLALSARSYLSIVVPAIPAGATKVRVYVRGAASDSTGANTYLQINPSDETSVVFTYGDADFTTGLNVNAGSLGPWGGAAGTPAVLKSAATGWELTGDGLVRLAEVSDPSAPAADKAVLFVKDNGSGKTQLCVRFSSGAVQVIATQP